MKIQVRRGCIILKPENEAESHQLESIEQHLRESSTKHYTERQWQILELSIETQIDE